jgi:NADH-quinone oxidoreductase subunit L
MSGEQDMRKMGGLAKHLPVTYRTFLIATVAISGIPPLAGFFSKDEILAALHGKGWPHAHAEHHEAGPAHHAAVGPAVLPATGFSAAGTAADFVSDTRVDAAAADSAAVVLDRPATWRVLFWMSLVTAGLTAFYTFRAVFMTFTGPTRVPDEAGHHAHESPLPMTGPLVVLAVASAVSGWWLFTTHALADFLAATPSFAAPAVAATAVPHAFHVDLAVQGTLAAAIGIVVAAFGHLGRRSDGPQLERFLGPLRTLFAEKFYFDPIYSGLIVKPLQALAYLAALIDRLVVDGLVDALARLPAGLGAIVRRLQSGLLQRYALAGALGTLLVVLALTWRMRG